MAYDSDTRVKETLKDISRKAKLKNLELRCFDESNEDQRHWTDGGLTFGPKDCLYGSNDAGWFLNEPFFINGIKISDYTPVLAVEGSYGTETGNTGSAQYARFSHALGAVKEGFIGVYFIPFESFYRKGDGRTTTAYVRYDMIYAALNASEREPGEYLFIDAYDENLMTEFLKILDEGKQANINTEIYKIKSIMKRFADSHNAGDRRKYAYNNGRIGKILMFNVVAFSSYNFRTKQRYRLGRFRNGHTIVGDALTTLYWRNKPIDLILPRFTHEDCRALDKLHQKEWLLLRKTGDITIITLDDLEFVNEELKKDLYNFIDELPLRKEKLKRKNFLVKKLREEFSRGRIKIDYDKVNKNEYK